MEQINNMYFAFDHKIGINEVGLVALDYKSNLNIIEVKSRVD